MNVPCEHHLCCIHFIHLWSRNAQYQVVSMILNCFHISKHYCSHCNKYNVMSI